MGETSLQLQPDSVCVEGGGIENQLSTWAGALKPLSYPECLVAEDIRRLRLAHHFPESGDVARNPTEAHTPQSDTRGLSVLLFPPAPLFHSSLCSPPPHLKCSSVCSHKALTTLLHPFTWLILSFLLHLTFHLPFSQKPFLTTLLCTPQSALAPLLCPPPSRFTQLCLFI